MIQGWLATKKQPMEINRESKTPSLNGSATPHPLGARNGVTPLPPNLEAICSATGKGGRYEIVEKFERAGPGSVSDSAAFAKWQKQPHRIPLESEGNTLYRDEDRAKPLGFALMNSPNANTPDAIQPVWIRVPEARKLTGISRSKMYELLAAGRVRSASLREPGQRHATRLIDRASLLAFIESHVETTN